MSSVLPQVSSRCLVYGPPGREHSRLLADVNRSLGEHLVDAAIKRCSSFRWYRPVVRHGANVGLERLRLGDVERIWLAMQFDVLEVWCKLVRPII